MQTGPRTEDFNELQLQQALDIQKVEDGAMNSEMISGNSVSGWLSFHSSAESQTTIKLGPDRYVTS